MQNFDDKSKGWDSNPIHIQRAQAVAGAIRDNVLLMKDMNALEYGCGTGLVSFELYPFLGKITLVDSSVGMNAVLQDKIDKMGIKSMTAVCGDLDTICQINVKYDLVYMSMVFHHMEETDKALRSFYSLVNDSGFLCIADLDREDGSFHGADFLGHNGFDREELRTEAKKAGFVNVEFTTCHVIKRDSEKGIREFPVFLMTARKQGT